jgi:hypothetical protein
MKGTGFSPYIKGMRPSKYTVDLAVAGLAG